MYRGLTVSALLHCAILGWALLAIQKPAELHLPDVTPISVEIVTPSELTRIKQGDDQSKILEAKAGEKPQPDPSKIEAPKPKPPPPAPPAPPPPPPPEPAKSEPAKSEPAKAEPVKAAPEPPKPDPIAEKLAAIPPPPPEPEPTPGPTPDEQKALADKLEQERVGAEQRQKAEEKRKADLKKKADDAKKKKDLERKLAEDRRKAEEAKKRQFDADRMAALIDKSPDPRGAPPASATPPARPTNNTGPTAGQRDGRDSVLSAREADLLKGLITARLRGCWRLPGAGGGTETPIVTLKWRLTPDGTLEGEPTVEKPQNSPVFQIAAEAALRAVKCASPFQLPADKYDAWRTITWDFDPSQML